MKQELNKVKNLNVKEIKDPSFLHDLSYEELDELSSKIREEIIDVTSRFGGHLSSNLGVVEATIALHRTFDFKKDKIIFDVGHQCYTHKILTGRSLENLRTKGGPSGFQKIAESEYDHFEAGHSSTSISVANGFAIARDLNHEKYDVIAFIGDGSIASGLAFEGLNNIAHSPHKVIVVLNDNEMSISRPVGGLGKAFANISLDKGYNEFKGFLSKLTKTKVGRKIHSFLRRSKNWIRSKLVPATVFDNLGLNFIGPIDGHNIKKMERAFQKAKNSSKSVVIDICTHKGKGYGYAESDRTGYWHGVSPFNIETGKPLNSHEGYISWSHLFSDITLEGMERNDEIVVISPATQKGSGLENIFEKYKDRTIDVGISEEHAATMASSLALSGYQPIISIYSTFMQRAFDEISHDVARMNTNVTFLVDRSGLVGADGETHQGIYDEFFLVNTPNCVVSMPSDAKEAKALFNESLQKHGPFFIRYPRSFLKKEEHIEDIKLEFGKWIIKRESKKKDTLIISVGPITNDLVSLIDKEKLDYTVALALYINPLDEEFLKESLGYKRIAIYDAYATKGGFTSALLEKLNDLGYKGEVREFAIPKVFVAQASIDEQLESFGLLPKQILEQLE